jgi:hypothetical protein
MAITIETITKSVNAFIKEDIIVNEIAVTVKKMIFRRSQIVKIVTGNCNADD